MTMPEMKPVKSSNIVAMGLDEATQTLYVEFPGKVIWTYANVTKDIYDEMLKAPSVGRHFHHHIKVNDWHKATKYVAEKKPEQHTGGMPFGGQSL